MRKLKVHAGKTALSCVGKAEKRNGGTEWSFVAVGRAACERSKGGGCKCPKNEGCRRLPFTAGLACFFAFGMAKASVANERNETGVLAWNGAILAALKGLDIISNFQF